MLGRIAVEDDEELGSLPLRPRAGTCDEVVTRDIRPRRAAHILRIDDDSRQMEPLNVSHAPSLPDLNPVVNQ